MVGDIHHFAHQEGRPDKAIRQIDHHCKGLGLRISALPPGWIDMRVTCQRPTLNVAPFSAGAVNKVYEVNGRDVRGQTASTRGLGLDLFGVGSEVRIVTTTRDWECLVDFEETALERIAPEAFEGAERLRPDLVAHRDDDASYLAALAVHQLRLGTAMDNLYVDALTLALVVRSLGLALSGVRPVSTGGTDPRIERALGFIEENLEEKLTVQSIATEAAMSPSWFQTAFKTATGRPVFAHVRERRLERARTLLADRRLSLSQIAYACGFSSHSHMTRLFTAKYGITPTEMRK